MRQDTQGGEGAREQLYNGAPPRSSCIKTLVKERNVITIVRFSNSPSETVIGLYTMLTQGGNKEKIS